MGMIPKVSIIVPIYNVEKFLEECLESLINQTLRDIEIICVNDGSTDSSLTIIQKYAAKDNRIVVIDKVNTGYGNSMNCGLDMATGEYIGIVESDDFAELTMFETLYEIATKNNVDVVKSNYYAYWAHPTPHNELVEVLSKVAYNRVLCPTEEKEIFYVKPCIWAALYKHSFLSENKIFFTETPGASYQDTGFNFKIWACAERAYFVSEAYLHYRRDNDNSSVKSTAKVFCVCDEYEEIEHFLQKQPEKYEKLVCLKNRLKYETYRWNLERLSTDLKLAFLQRMSEEFSIAKNAGELERTLFNFPQWKMIEDIINNPETYFVENYSQLAEMENPSINSVEMEQKQRRVISKTIRYFKIHGFKETIKKINEKLFT